MTCHKSSCHSVWLNHNVSSQCLMSVSESNQHSCEATHITHGANSALWAFLIMKHSHKFSSQIFPLLTNTHQDITCMQGGWASQKSLHFCLSPHPLMHSWQTQMCLILICISCTQVSVLKCCFLSSHSQSSMLDVCLVSHTHNLPSNMDSVSQTKCVLLMALGWQENHQVCQNAIPVLNNKCDFQWHLDFQTSFSPCLCSHKWCLVTFVLLIEEFWLHMCVGMEHANHLLSCSNALKVAKMKRSVESLLSVAIKQWAHSCQTMRLLGRWWSSKWFLSNLSPTWHLRQGRSSGMMYLTLKTSQMTLSGTSPILVWHLNTQEDFFSVWSTCGANPHRDFKVQFCSPIWPLPTDVSISSACLWASHWETMSAGAACLRWSPLFNSVRVTSDRPLLSGVAVCVSLNVWLHICKLSQESKVVFLGVTCKATQTPIFPLSGTCAKSRKESKMSSFFLLSFFAQCLVALHAFCCMVLHCCFRGLQPSSLTNAANWFGIWPGQCDWLVDWMTTTGWLIYQQQAHS